MALGIVFAGGLASEAGRPATEASTSGGRRAAARDAATTSPPDDLKGVSSRVLARTLARRVRSAATRRIRPGKGSAR